MIQMISKPALKSKARENWIQFIRINCRGVVGRVSVFHPGCPGSIPGAVRNFSFYSGTECVSFVLCPMLSLAVPLSF